MSSWGTHTEHGPRPSKSGTDVVRNELGEQRYNAPRDGQLARITRVFAEPKLDEDGKPDRRG